MAQRKKPQLLKDLEINEVSNVDRPANQHSLHVLHKFNQDHDPKDGEFASGSAGAKVTSATRSDVYDVANQRALDATGNAHQNSAYANRESARNPNSVSAVQAQETAKDSHLRAAEAHRSAANLPGVPQDAKASHIAAASTHESLAAHPDWFNTVQRDHYGEEGGFTGGGTEQQVKPEHVMDVLTAMAQHGDFGKPVNKGQPTPADVHIPAAIGAIAPAINSDSIDVSETPCKKCGKVHAQGACPMKKNMADRAASFIKNFFKTDVEQDDVDEEPIDFQSASSQLVSSIRKSAKLAKNEDDYLNEVGEHLAVFNAQIIEKISEGLDTDVDPLMPDAGALSGEPVKTEKGMKTSEKEAKLAELRKQLSETEALVPEDQKTDPVNKADELSPVAKAEIQKVADENAKLRDSINKMQKENNDRAALEEARTLVGKSGLKAESVALLLSKSDDEGKVAIKEMVAKAVAFAKQAQAFEEVGADGEDGGANVEFAKAVDENMKADHKLTREQAIRKTLEENPELYENDIDDQEDE